MSNKSQNKREIHGLNTGQDAPLEVRPGGIAERGIFVTEFISKGQWLCEYKGIVYPHSKMQQHIDEYNKNEEGCYIITSKHPVGYLTKLCWNATRHFHQIGRYINHAQNPNALLTQPLHVRGKWRVGFLAARDINVGDEVVWDYRVRGEVWSKCRLVDGVVVGDKDAIQTKV